MDESVEQVALVVSLVSEVRSQVPIPKTELEDKFANLWIQNDPQVHLEITSVLAMKAYDFSPHCMTHFRELMESHCGPRNIPIVEAMTKLEDQKTQIQEQEFMLVMNQLQYDVDAWRVHKQTLSDYGSAVHKQKHTRNLKRHEQSGKAADAFL